MAASFGTSRTGTSVAMDPKVPGINVHNVLKILNSRLGSGGNIKDTKDVAFVTVLMAEAVKLVDRCMFLNVLRATRSHTILRAMLDTGGWATLHNWLQQCRSEDGNAFLTELLLLYKHLPVSVELLRQNSCAKDIKQLMKSSDDKIAGLAKHIVSSWMEKVKEKGSAESSSKHSDKSSSSHRHSHSSSSKSSSSDKTGASNVKDKSSSSQSLTASKEKTVKPETTSYKDDVDPSRVKTLEDSPDHITAKLNHRSLSADRGAPSMLTIDQSSNSSNSMSVDNDSSLPQPPAVHRPKTVKMIGSKMRSTGLELDTPLLPSKKKVPSPSDRDKVVPPALTVKPQSSKKIVSDKKSPTHAATSSSSSSSLMSSPPAVDAKPKIKLIPAKPRPPEIYESSGFMDALNSTDALIRRKRKLSTQAQAKPGTTVPVPVSPDDKKVMPLSLQREAMDTDDISKKTESSSSDVQSQQPTDDKSTSEQSAAETSACASDVTASAGSKASTISSEQVNEDSSSKDSLLEPANKKKKIKAVSWADDSKLCNFFYFQLDENERVNVNKLKDFAEIRKHEQEMERQMMQNVRRMAHDVMSEKQVWRKPFLITGLSQVVVSGCNSKEKDIQRERELGVLQVLYFSKNMIPDSAAEPEPEYFELIEPKIIPLSDETGLGCEIVYDSAVQSTIGNGQQPMTSLPPAIASLLSATANQVQNAAAGSSSLLVPQMSPNASQPQPNSSPNVSLPPLNVFLNMPFNAQQHIFKSMPPHIQQQMMNSLPPLLQQQLAPLVVSPPALNGSAPPFVMQPGPVSVPPDARPNGPPILMAGSGPQPFPPPGPNFPRRMPTPLMDVNVRRPMPPEATGFPPRVPPHVMMIRGGPPQANRVCTHFMAGSCRYGTSCRNIHPPRDGGIPAGGAGGGHDSPH